MPPSNVITRADLRLLIDAVRSLERTIAQQRSDAQREPDRMYVGAFTAAFIVLSDTLPDLDLQTRVQRANDVAFRAVERAALAHMPAFISVPHHGQTESPSGPQPRRARKDTSSSGNLAAPEVLEPVVQPSLLPVPQPRVRKKTGRAKRPRSWAAWNGKPYSSDACNA